MCVYVWPCLYAVCMYVGVLLNGVDFSWHVMYVFNLADDRDGDEGAQRARLAHPSKEGQIDW